MSGKYVPFSERAGRRQPLQLGMQDMPSDLRTSLWNIIEPWIWSKHGLDDAVYKRKVRWVYNFRRIRWPTHECPSWTSQHLATARLHSWFMDSPADDVYDFIEELPGAIFAIFDVPAWDYATLNGRDMSQAREVATKVASYHRSVNEMLEREGSPYRIVDNLLVPITNQAEIAEVRAAATGQDRFAVARGHIAEGLKHLGARPPAYADCIKQAVSAVESVLKIDAGDDTWRMAKLLTVFEQKHGKLHQALRDAIDKVYGYASDEEGVRHGAAAPVTVGDAEARALLVTCSALTNFLIRKAGSKA